MKAPLFAVAIAALVFSCSKPSQESNSTADSTVDQSSSDNSDGRTPLELTAEEADRINEELFLFIHRGMVHDKTVALKEEFSVDGNTFKYTLVRHNLDNYGIESNSYSGNRDPSQEEIDAYEADTSANKEYPMGEGYTQTNYYYNSQIDTFYIDGDYSAFADDPEATPRKVMVVLANGGVVHQNAADVGEDEVPIFSAKQYSYYNPIEGPDFLGQDEFSVNLGEPLEFKADELYIKAKIKDLTKEDLAGLTKDQLAFVRNDIFAHHGHTFKTSKMVTRYQNADWYHAIIPDAAPFLNKFEKRNVDQIKKMEG